MVTGAAGFIGSRLARLLLDDGHSVIGVDAYIAEEVLPSITILQDAGYQPTAFAYPFGRNTEAADDAVLELVDKVRISPSPCPY